MCDVPDARPRPAPAFVTSCVLGTLGALFLLAGVLAGSDVLVVVATALGALSLAAALVWRGQLIRTWHSDRYRRSVPPPESPSAL